jgi:organic hydroperoxide reductase OsmC/OhrA
MQSTAKIVWKKNESEKFTDNRYSRQHTWLFDGGIEIKASSSPQVVPLPMSIENAVDPEEALVASVSSCHMLWFLSIAAQKKFIIESYEDEATGILSPNEEGKQAMANIILKPKIIFSDAATPTSEQLNELHHAAHEKCYIANSLKTKIEIITE